MEPGAKPTASEKSSFTVFKSPPWSVPQSIKHVTFSEAFPAIGGFGGGKGRVKMALSRSLESIPENAVWHAGRPGVAMANDVAAAVRGPVLPPIKRIADGELPEMRARAFSDPNAYRSNASSKDRHQQQAAANASWRTEGGGGRGSGDSKTSPAAAAAAPRAPVTPPPKKSPSPKQLRKTSKRSSLDSAGGDDSTAAEWVSGGGGGSSGAAKDADAAARSRCQHVGEQRLDGPRLGPRLAAPLGAYERAQNALGAEPAPAGAPSSKAAGGVGGGAKVGGGSWTAQAPASSGGGAAAAGSVRGRLAGTAAASTADFPSPPSPLATPPRFLKGLGGGDGAEEQGGGGGGGQPRIVHPPNADKSNRNHLNRYLRLERDGGEAPRTAYALVGSPGRKRWPSPQRQATSFIAAHPSAAASVGVAGSHSYSGPMSPIARAAAAAEERASRSGCGGSGSSSSVGSDDDYDDEEQPIAVAPARSRGSERAGAAAAAAADLQPPASSCSKEFQAILSGFFAGGSSSPSPSSSPRVNSYGRQGDAFDDTLTESRAHFLRAGCRPVSDGL